MSGTVDDKKRLIRVTAGNLKNNSISIAGHYDFFPSDCIGPPKKSHNGQSRPIEIVLDGLNKTIETDIGTDAKTGKPRRNFRGRKWVREFFEHNQIETGDVLALEKVDTKQYRLLLETTAKRNDRRPSLQKNAVKTGVESVHRLYYRTKLGRICLGDALTALEELVPPQSVDLIMTSPPFGLVRKKDYGNVDADSYVAWFRPFGELFRRVLKPNGSLVIEIGGAWIPGQPTRSLYHYELLIMLCRQCRMHLAQEFFCWNPAKLPTPAEWVTVRRVRVKDAVNCVWWLSPTPWPKASNRRVLVPYSDSMKDLLKNGYRAKLRPSGHDISKKFAIDNGAAIPPNIIALAHTESNSFYLRYCKERDIKPHPARFPAELPEYFIRMLTDPGDCVVDPFAGSCVTGEAAERLNRKWLCVEVVEDYLRGALGRFQKSSKKDTPMLFQFPAKRKTEYKLSHPGALWDSGMNDSLPADGGRERHIPNKLRKRDAANDMN